MYFKSVNIIGNDIAQQNPKAIKLIDCQALYFIFVTLPYYTVVQQYGSKDINCLRASIFIVYNSSLLPYRH